MSVEEFKKFLVDNNICVRSQFYKPLQKIDLYFTKKDGFKYKYTIEDSNLSGIDDESIDYSYVWTYLTDSADHDRIIKRLKHAIYEYNKSNDADITIEEFKEFLEKKHINIDISHRRDTGILTGKFYISDDNILYIYEVKSGFHSIYGMEDDVLLYHCLSLLAEKENLKDVRDAIVSALAGDKCVTNKVESPDDSKDTKMYIDDILKKKDDGTTFNEFKEFLEKNRRIIQFKTKGRDRDLIKIAMNSIYGSFYWLYEPPYATTNELSIDRLKDIFLKALDNKLAIDGIKICEVESSKKEDNSAGPIITGGIEMPSIREQTLDAAKRCIMGDREQDYGTPESNFATIASFWSDYLGMNISAQQVADMMILMKISRIKNGGGTGDSYVDIAGYAACGNEILSKKG